jgi:O-antigen ligase
VLLAVSRNTMSSILLFLFFAHFYRMSSLTGFMILIVSAMVYQVINNNLVDILHSLGLSSFLRADTLENGAGRMIAWKFGWKVIQGHFFVGQGFSYDEWVFYANRHWLMLLGHQGAVHNSYLALWINTGIIGLILYMSGFFYTYYKISLRSYFALPMMFAVMFSIMFEAWLMGSLNPFNAVYILVIHILLHEDVQLEPPQKEASLIPVS